MNPWEMSPHQLFTLVEQLEAIGEAESGKPNHRARVARQQKQQRRRERVQREHSTA